MKIKFCASTSMKSAGVSRIVDVNDEALRGCESDDDVHCVVDEYMRDIAWELVDLWSELPDGGALTLDAVRQHLEGCDE